MKYDPTFMGTGGLTIEAGSEEEARAKFDELQDLVCKEILANGIDLTGIQATGE